MAYSLEKAKARVAIVARLRRALKALGARGGCGLVVIAAQASQLLQELSAADIAALQLGPEVELEQLNPERLAMLCRGGSRYCMQFDTTEVPLAKRIWLEWRRRLSLFKEDIWTPFDEGIIAYPVLSTLNTSLQGSPTFWQEAIAYATLAAQGLSAEAKRNVETFQLQWTKPGGIMEMLISHQAHFKLWRNQEETYAEQVATPAADELTAGMSFVRWSL